MNLALGVQSKIPSLCHCQYRPSRPDEVDKHDGTVGGNKGVNEGLGTLKSEYLAVVDSLTPTVKHDGTCVMLLRDDSCIRAYRRLDIRDGRHYLSDMPPGTLMAHGDFFWVPINDSVDPSDQYHLSAFSENFKKVNLVVPTDDGYSLETVNCDSIQEGTYELLGCKVQSNRYDLPSDVMTRVTVERKGISKEINVPKHYLIRHGAFIARLTSDELSSYDMMKKYILDHNIEGLVMYQDGVPIFKINRDHIRSRLPKGKHYRMF